MAVTEPLPDTVDTELSGTNTPYLSETPLTGKLDNVRQQKKRGPLAIIFGSASAGLGSFFCVVLEAHRAAFRDSGAVEGARSPDQKISAAAANEAPAP